MAAENRQRKVKTLQPTTSAPTTPPAIAPAQLIELDTARIARQFEALIRTNPRRIQRELRAAERNHRPLEEAAD